MTFNNEYLLISVGSGSKKMCMLIIMATSNCAGLISKPLSYVAWLMTVAWVDLDALHSNKIWQGF